MKYGVFGDIHGNLEALNTVIEEMGKQKLDGYICVGDLVGYGANPSECISLVRDINPVVVAGNHDWAAIGKINSDYFNFYAKEAINWTSTVLSSEEKAWLSELPLIEIGDKFTVAHSTIFKPELFSYVQTSYDAHLSFEQMDSQVGFVGHSHIPVTFLCQDYISFTLDTMIVLQNGEKALINVGSVGQPRDENPRAAYGIFDDQAGTIELHRIEYDINLTTQKIKEAGLPSILADRLFVGQ
ncbi:metallophosphoesterase family protein [Planctomycetota bacterium]